MIMPIQHKFLQKDFKNRFQTHNAILDVTPYKPEVMIIGTFNPDTPNANFADFFYGRNFLWTGFKNLFLHNAVVLPKRRMHQIGQPPNILDPTLPEIFELCCKLKLTFSDLISEVLHVNEPQYQLLHNDNVLLDDQEYNLIQDERKENVYGLHQLDNLQPNSQVNWNTRNIIKYLCDNPQIRSIYFTRRPTGIWANHWNQIVNDSCMSGRNLTNIFTPSGAGSPVSRSMERLLNHWVHNVTPNFGKLDNDWLINKGVTLSNF